MAVTSSEELAGHVAGWSLERLPVLSHKDYICAEARKGVCGVQCGHFRTGRGWLGSIQNLQGRGSLAGPLVLYIAVHIIERSTKCNRADQK